MPNTRSIILFLLIFISLSTNGQQQSVVKKDLRNSWLLFDGKQYVQAGNESVSTIYIQLNAALYKHDYLLLDAPVNFSLLINNTVSLDRITYVKLSIDSLAKPYKSTSLFITLTREQAPVNRNLTTQIISNVLIPIGTPDISYLRSSENFRNFAITAILVLIIFLVSIIRLNPGLSSDYFSVLKIFSLRESEDDHYYYRVTSATILFYVFTSLMISLFMLVVSRFTTVDVSGLNFSAAVSYWMFIFTWLKITLYILGLLFIKVSIIYLVSMLFGIREIAGYHFFNFVRLLLVSMGLLAFVLVLYFIPHGQREGFYSFLYSTLPWILGAWIVLGFFKLAKRVRHSAFHLFSYICATELIPFFIIIEVLNK